jgi:hypothetical protein
VSEAASVRGSLPLAGLYDNISRTGRARLAERSGSRQLFGPLVAASKRRMAMTNLKLSGLALMASICAVQLNAEVDVCGSKLIVRSIASDQPVHSNQHKDVWYGCAPIKVATPTDLTNLESTLRGTLPDFQTLKYSFDSFENRLQTDFETKLETRVTSAVKALSLRLVSEDMKKSIIETLHREIKNELQEMRNELQKQIEELKDKK